MFDNNLVKATSPIHKSADPNLMNSFCSKVNADPEGHHQAIRLISHKIQSPQEHEALRTLELLEVCVQSCGRRFHQEIGKFRFLNEMIKLVSPKVKIISIEFKIKSNLFVFFSIWQIIHQKKSKKRLLNFYIPGHKVYRVKLK
jgi:ADP-ribosylation factor-binding protein GGA